MGLSLISRAPSEYQKVVLKAVSFSPVFPYLVRNCSAERERGKKKPTTQNYFPRETLSSHSRRCLPLHAEVRSSAHSFTLTNCSVSPGAGGLPALSPSGNPIQPPRSESARHPPMFTHSSSFDIFLLPGSNDRQAPAPETPLTALDSISCLTQTFPVQGSV